MTRTSTVPENLQLLAQHIAAHDEILHAITAALPAESLDLIREKIVEAEKMWPDERRYQETLRGFRNLVLGDQLPGIRP